MEWYVILGYILFGCFFIGMVGGSVVFALRNRKSTIDRARKIDPTVKTLQDAQYVLTKDLAQSVGTGKTENNK